MIAPETDSAPVALPRSEAVQQKVQLALSFGKGESAYIAAKQWIENNYPDITPAQYAQACRLAAQMAGV